MSLALLGDLGVRDLDVRELEKRWINFFRLPLKLELDLVVHIGADQYVLRVFHNHSWRPLLLELLALFWREVNHRCIVTEAASAGSNRWLYLVNAIPKQVEARSAEATKPLPKRKKLAWWIYVLLVLLVLLASISGFYGIWYFRARNALAAEIAAARQRGEVIYFSDLEPEPVSTADNAAPIYFQAMRILAPDTVAFDTAIQRADQIVWSPNASERSKFNDTEFQIQLDANRQALNLIRQAFQKPRSQFPCDYRTPRPAGLLLPQMERIPYVARLFSAEFHVARASGDTKRAIQAMEDTYSLAELLREEPLLVPQLRRMRIAEMATKELEILLADGALSDGDFSRIDARLQAMESSSRLRSCMLAERAMLVTATGNLAENKEIHGNETTVYPERYLPPLAMEEQAFVMRYLGEVAAAVDVAGPAGKSTMDSLTAELNQVPTRHVALRQLMYPPETMRNAGLQHRQRLQNARVALRVDRYWREHGRLPANLSEILDDALTELPNCLFSDKALVFKVHPGGGFSVYGLGENGVDEGADGSDRQEVNSAFRVLYAP